MSDVTLCVNTMCLKRRQCHWYITLPKMDEKQSFARFECSIDNDWEHYREWKEDNIDNKNKIRKSKL